MIAYLDHNATSPVRPEVVDGMSEALCAVGNPSSVHGGGRAARQRLERARRQVADLVGVDPGQVIFTSGGTEANNLAVLGSRARRLLVSAVEHHSILETIDGFDGRVETVPVDKQGVVDLLALERMMATSDGPALVSVMAANNETGVIQPIAEVVRLARAFGARVHCDGVQAAGKVSLRVGDLGVDSISLSAHKIGGPQGVGALVLAADNKVLDRRQFGGRQEDGRRAGTENVPGIVGFGLAAELAARDLGDYARLADLRDDLERRIADLAPAAVVYGAASARLPNTVCVSMPGVGSETQVMAFDLAGVSISAGAACSSGKVTPSHVLAAMGVGEDEAYTAIRVSMGWNTGSGDIDRFVSVWRDLYLRVRSQPQAREFAA